MSGLNKIFHKTVWFLEHVESHISFCGRSGRSWLPGTNSSGGQCYQEASQAAGGAARTLWMCLSEGSQDHWHAKHSSLRCRAPFKQVFAPCAFFLQGTVILTSPPSVMLQVQLWLPVRFKNSWKSGNRFFFSKSVESLPSIRIYSHPGWLLWKAKSLLVSPFPTLDWNTLFWHFSLWMARAVHDLFQFTSSVIVCKEPAALITAMWSTLSQCFYLYNFLCSFSAVSTSLSPRKLVTGRNVEQSASKPSSLWLCLQS